MVNSPFCELCPGAPISWRFGGECWDLCAVLGYCGRYDRPFTPSADVPACRDEDSAHTAALAACYPDPPEYQHPEDDPNYPDERCISCGAEIDHYLGCPDDPDPDYEAEAELEARNG